MYETYSEIILRLKAENNGRELITVSRAANILGIDKRTIMAHNLLPVKKIGSRFYISIAEIAALLMHSPP